MKLRKIGALITVAILIVLVATAVREIRRGFSARAKPSAAETFVAETARKMAVPSSYKTLENPYAASPENLHAGMEHFADHCATCHANDGSGDTLFGRGLYPKPPDMRTAETQKESDGELYYTIENGVRLSGMPAFGEEHAHGGDSGTWKLVLFIRHLPKLTASELKEMEQLNPKTDQEREEEKEEQDFLRGSSSQGSSSTSHHH
jgi:mono/diheme cytochrome c family protein